MFYVKVICFNRSSQIRGSQSLIFESLLENINTNIQSFLKVYKRPIEKGGTSVGIYRTRDCTWTHRQVSHQKTSV